MTLAAQIAIAHTGAIVITNGRIVSLAEWESRSNAWKTRTVPHAGYGFEFPPIGQRMDRLDEALTIIKRMFTEERPSFEGKHFRIDRALNSPRPIQPGGPKVLVGGGGEADAEAPGHARRHRPLVWRQPG